MITFVKVIRNYVKEKLRFIESEEFKGLNQETIVHSLPNIESLPMENDIVSCFEPIIKNESFAMGIAFETDIEAGELKIFSKDKDGNKQVEAYFMADGTLSLKNDAGETKFNSDGSIDLSNGTKINADSSVDFKNGAKIDATGDFISAKGVSLNNHTHQAGTLLDSLGQPVKGITGIPQ